MGDLRLQLQFQHQRHRQHQYRQENQAISRANRRLHPYTTNCTIGVGTAAISNSNTNRANLSAPNVNVAPQSSAPVSESQQLFYSMDSNGDGLISWREFLSYLNQSEARMESIKPDPVGVLWGMVSMRVQNCNVDWHYGNFSTNWM